jgi:tetratricopeptide (TPR) repeat protein
MPVQRHSGNAGQPQRFTISFAGFDRPWAAWIAHRLEQLGHRVVLQRWDPPITVPLEQAFRDLLIPRGRVLVVLSDTYLRLGPRTDEEWNHALRTVVAENSERFAAVSLTDQTLPTAAVALDRMDLWGIDANEAEHRIATLLDLPLPEPQEPGDPRPGPRYPNDPPLVWGGVPRRNTRFTGRDTILGTLHDELNQAPSGAAVCTLLGMSGVGKTQIAVEYAYRFASSYDVVWWVPADQRGTMRERLADLAPALDLPTGSEYGERIRAVQEALRRGTPHARWLLVFDGADEPEHLVDLLPSGPGHVLITSRNHEWNVHNSEVLEIPVYTREESVAFVRRRARRLTAVEADQLSAALEDFPLLLDQTAGWLSESAMEVAEYVGMLHTGLNSHVGLLVSPEYPMTFQTSWSILLNNLRDTVPEAVELLRLCSFFAPGPVPLRLLRAIPKQGLPERLGWLMNDPLRWNNALKKLVQYSVVRLEYLDTPSPDEGPGVETVQMHRLVHGIVRSTMSEEDERSLSRAVRRVLAEEDPDRPSDSRTWPRYAELVPHLESSGALGSTNPRIQAFVLNCLRYLHLLGEYRSCLQLCRKTEPLWEAILGTDHSRMWELRYHMANALMQLGRYRESERLNRATVEYMVRERGENDLDTLRAKSGVGAVLGRLGRYREDREIQEANWLRYRELLGEDDALTLSAQNNLAVALRLEGRYQESYELDLDTLRRRERVLRPRHPSTLSSGISCVLGLRLMGRYAEALSRAEQGVRLHLRVLGATHPQTLRAQHNLALCLRRSGDRSAAETLMRGVLDRSTRVLGTAAPETLLVASDYAVFVRANGALEQARRRTEEVLRHYQDLLGEAHPYTIGVKGNLGLVLRAQGERDEALSVCEQALAGMRTALGDEHPWTLGCALNAAGSRNLVGRVESAADLSRETLRAATTVLGPEHPLTLSCQTSLASDLRLLRQHEEAEKVERDALQLLSRSLGADHPHTIAARSRVRPYWDFEPQSA